MRFCSVSMTISFSTPIPKRGNLSVEHLDRYIIADDVTLEDVTEATFSLGLEGPKATDVASHCGLAAPHHRFSHVRSGDLLVAAISATGSHGVRVYGAIRSKDEAIATIEGAGAIAATADDAETVRIENFVPRYGCEITEHTLPQETQQMHALHFRKAATSARRSWSASVRAGISIGS